MCHILYTRKVFIHVQSIICMSTRVYFSVVNCKLVGEKNFECCLKLCFNQVCSYFNWPVFRYIKYFTLNVKNHDKIIIET